MRQSVSRSSGGSTFSRLVNSVPGHTARTTPAAAALQRLQLKAASSPQSQAMMTLQRRADAALQRQGGMEEELQGKFASTLQRMDEEELQGKFPGALQRVDGLDEEELQGKFASPAVQREATPSQSAASGGLPSGLQSGIESLSGHDVSDVKVHYNSSAPANVGALAYTQGSDIHVGPGQEQHLPHEAWHTVQQREGRVQPTGTVAGLPLNDDVGLEHEADVMGSRAASEGAAQQKRMED